MLLTVEGYQVITAASLTEATEKAKASPDIDLLVTDYHLGKSGTGSQVIEQVRAIAGASLGAILISGDTSSTVRGLGTDPRLRIASKPIDAEELLRLVDGLLLH